MTPYTTRSGLQVGSLYTAAPQHPYHDADALLLQRALLGERRRVDWDGLYIVAVVAVVAAAVVASLTWGAAR